MHKADFKDLLSSALLALLTGIGASFFFAALVLLLSAEAMAEETSEHSGTLHVHTASGQVIRHVPRLTTDVQIKVSGMLARVHVKQRFLNPSPEWVEAVYVFPLPQDSAVDHMRMVAGERVIEGEIQEKSRARKTYEQAKFEGRRASLVEQQRPNMFTTSLANIPPGEEILVEIEYQQAVQHHAGVFSLRFPMVVGPRYVPGTPIEQTTSQFDGLGWGRATAQVPDAAQITPPVIAESESRSNPVSLDVQLQTGLQATDVRSLYHPVRVQAVSEGEQRVGLLDGEVPADRDFVLQWRLADGGAPAAALFQEQWQDRHYGLLMITPPAAGNIDESQLPSRELILVVDTSGSMYGESIEQARAALQVALARLRPRDRFNIIQFSDTLHALYSHAVRADPANLSKAQRYVDSLQAEGGTEMGPAMRLALSAAQDNGLLRQVVFLTDGDIGNEQTLFATINDRLGDSRLFPVAIGSAPNSWFMTRAAAFGRGSYTYIGDLAEVQEKMESLFERLAAPLLTGVRVAWQGGGEQVQSPHLVPDLYAGEPLLLAVQSETQIESVRIEGMLGKRPWTHEVKVDGGAQAAGVHVLWARRVIADWMARRSLGDDPEQVRSEVLALALVHHLVSPYTSLVAVDRTPVRPAEEALHSKAVPTNLPKGWSQAHVFGGLPQTATPALLHTLLGLALLGLAGLGYRRWWA